MLLESFYNSFLLTRVLSFHVLRTYLIRQKDVCNMYNVTYVLLHVILHKWCYISLLTASKKWYGDKSCRNWFHHRKERIRKPRYTRKNIFSEICNLRPFTCSRRICLWRLCIFFFYRLAWLHHAVDLLL